MTLFIIKMTLFWLDLHIVQFVFRILPPPFIFEKKNKKFSLSMLTGNVNSLYKYDKSRVPDQHYYLETKRYFSLK